MFIIFIQIIAKRENSLPKSEYDILSLPPLPRLTDSYENKFTAKKSDSVSCREVKREEQSASPIPSQCSSNIPQKLNLKDEQSFSSIDQESPTNNSQVTSSSVQPAFPSPLQLTSSSSFQPVVTLLQTVNSVPRISSAVQPELYSNASVNSSGIQYGNTRNFSPVFSLGTSTFSNSLPNSSSNSTSTYPIPLQTAHAQVMPPQFTFPYPVSTPGIPSVPMDPRLYHGIIPQQNQTHLQNQGSSVPKNVNNSAITPKIQNQLPVAASLQSNITVFNAQSHKPSIASTSKKAPTETVKNHSRSTVSKAEKTNKKDCADIIVRYLTPYYKSGEVKSKVRIQLPLFCKTFAFWPTNHVSDFSVLFASARGKLELRPPVRNT